MTRSTTELRGSDGKFVRLAFTVANLDNPFYRNTGGWTSHYTLQLNVQHWRIGYELYSYNHLDLMTWTVGSSLLFKFQAIQIQVSE